MALMNTRRHMAGHCPLPWTSKDFEPQHVRIIYSHVVMVGDDVYEVFDWRTVAVWPTLHSCTCREWNVTHSPCRHACVVIRFMQHSVVNYLDHHTTEAFKRTYAPTLYLVTDLDKPNVWFSKIMSAFFVYLCTFVQLCPPFGISVHFCIILSTFWYFCPHISIFVIFVQFSPPFGIYVHLLVFMSTFWYLCLHVYNYVHLLAFLSIF